MKLRNIFLCIVILLYRPLQTISAKGDNLHSNQYILYNRNDESIISSKNGVSQIDPNIFTQWLSALLIIENTRHYDKEFSLGFNDFNTTFTSELGLGEYISVQDALFGILLTQDGSLANACGRHMAGSEQEFIRLLNKKAKSIGMKYTNFVNITGDREYDQYTTLQDLTILVHHAFQNNTFRKIISMEEYTFTTNYETHTLTNKGYNIFKNKNIYGTTEFQLSNSLYGIVSAYKEDNKEYLFVTLSDQENDCIEDTESIYTQTASSQHFIAPLKKENVIGNISLGLYLKRNIPIILQEDITILTNINIQLNELEYEFISNINPILILPNSNIGTVNIYKGNKLVKTSTITSSKLYISYGLYIVLAIVLCILCFVIYKKYFKIPK